MNEIIGYELLGTLGYGARSTIYLVKDVGDNHIYALKRVVKHAASDQRFLDQAILEHEIAQRFDHPTLRRSYKLIRQRKFLRTSEIFVLMEYVDGSTMETYRIDDITLMCQRACRWPRG
jgi:serine/threonine protein kinase